MTTRDFLLGVGVFALVLAAIVGGAAVGPQFIETAGTTDTSTAVPSAFEAGSVSVDSSEAGGSVTVDSDSTGDVIVVDTAHGNGQSTEQVQTLERLLVSNGYEVRYHGEHDSAGAAMGAGGLPGGLPASANAAPGGTAGIAGGGGPANGQSAMNESLRGADAYVIVNPSTRYDASDAKSVTAFADAGGRVLIMSDPKSLGIAELLAQSLGAGTGGSADSLAPMSSRLGIGVGSGYLYNMAEYDVNYQTIYASGSGDGLGSGVERVSVDRAAPVFAGPNATVALETDAATEHSDSGEGREYAIAARNRNVSIVGDTSLLDPARLHHGDNEVFVGNLIEFLVNGSVHPNALAPPEPERRPADQASVEKPASNRSASP